MEEVYEINGFIESGGKDMLIFTQEKWEQIIETFVGENHISETVYTAWIQYFKPYKVEGNSFTVLVDKEGLIVDAEWFMKKYRTPLESVIKEVTGIEFNVRFVLFAR